MQNEYKIANWSNWYEDDELVEKAKERQEFEGSASSEIKDTCRRKQMQKGREYKKETLDKSKEHAVQTEKTHR